MERVLDSLVTAGEVIHQDVGGVGLDGMAPFLRFGLIADTLPT
jgi:hypothetical protein